VRSFDLVLDQLQGGGTGPRLAEEDALTWTDDTVAAAQLQAELMNVGLSVQWLFETPYPSLLARWA
jgi:hypothetical protein